MSHDYNRRDACGLWDYSADAGRISRLCDAEGCDTILYSQKHIGRRPIAAFGNSDGDLQMLQWTAAGPGPRFCLYVHHTDADREWAYDHASHIGKLDKGLDEAAARGWTVVNMKDDWKRIFLP